MKLLCDTNILLDLILERMPHYEHIKHICIASYFGDVQLWANMQSYTDAYYVLRSSYSKSESKELLLGTLEFFIPVATRPADLKQALKSDWSDIEDYLIAHSAKQLDASFVITRDKEILQKSPLPAMEPGAFLAYLKDTQGLVYDDIEV